MNLNFCPNKKSKEFLEMVSALGGEKEAYFFWMRNNGNHLEKAPNGADSKLFNTLLDYFNGDRAEAIRAKAKVYKDEFFNWFGDWTSDTNDFNLDNIDYSLVDVEEYTKPWKDDPKKSNRAIRIYLKDQHEKGFFELVKDHEDGYFSVHFKTTKEGTEYNSSTAEPSSKEDRKILFQQLVNAIPNGAKISTWGSVSKDGIRGLDNVGRNMHKVGERSARLKSDDSEIKIPIYQKGHDVSKVVDENGEPLVVWHVSKNIFNTFDKSKIGSGLGLMDEDPDGFYFSEENIIKNDRYKIIYPVYINVLKMSDDLNFSFEKEENHRIYNGVVKEFTPNVDGMLRRDRLYVSGKSYDEFIVFSPNQIKSAVKNEGEFSTTDDNIYHHIDKNRTLQLIQQYIQDYIDNRFGKGHSYKEIKNKVLDLESQLGVLEVHVNSDKTLDFSFMHFVGDPRSRQNDIRRILGENILSSVLTLVLNINRLFPNLNIKVQEDLSIFQGDAYYDKYTNTIHYSPRRSGSLKSVDRQDIVEECLHPLIACIAATDNKLFKKLLELASKDVGLVSYISQAYKGKPQDIINQEIVTQAVAKMYANNTYDKLLSIDEFKRREQRRRFNGIISTIIEWINKLTSLITGDKLLVKNEDLSTVISSLNSLVDILNTVGIEFTEVDSGKMLENMRHVGASDNSSMNSILESNDQEELLKKATGDNAHLKVTAINTAINNTREAFVQRQVEKYLTTNEDASAADIYGVRIGSSVDWDEAAVKRVITEQQEKLASVFGLVKRELPNGGFVYTSSDKSKNSRLRVAFVNSITGEDWTDESGTKHKGMFEEGTKAEEAAWNAIYISIQDGDATTFVHEMVHYYIRTFWESLAVQDALVEVAHQNKMAIRENEDMQQYSKKLEEKLVEWITDEVTSEPKLTFWERINKLLHSFGKDINKDQNTRNNVLDTLQAAFSINEDLSDRVAEIIYFEKYIGPVHQDEMRRLSDEVDEIDGTTFWKIKSTLESREKSERSRGKADNYDLLNIVAHLQKILKRSITNKDDVTNTVSDFLLLAGQDIRRAIGTLSDIVLGGDTAIENLDIDDFMHLKTDVVGYYDTMLTNAIDEYLRDSKNITPELRSQLLILKNNILPNIALLKRNFDVILKRYVDKKIEQYANELVTVGDKDIFITNMKLWARNQIDEGKLLFAENALGPAVVSRSPIVRLIEYLVTAQNRISYESALNVGHELIDKYKKCASIGKKLMSVNFMKQFCELDDDGQPTGYFARQYNYGKLYKQRDKIIKKLVDKYNLTVDDDTNQITFRNRSEYIKYMTDFYNEMDKIANFRYKKEYYIKRAELLSPKAQEKERIVQRQIDTLLKKAVDKELGVPMIFNLSSEEIKQLDNLRREKQNLANPYNIVYNADGSILSIEEKTGEDLEIAKEFILWNAFKAGKIKYKSNWEKFNSVRDKIVEKYGEDSYQVKLFDYKYKSRKISDKFYEKLGNNKASAEIKELYARRSAIINSILKKRGYYQPNLKLLNDQAFAELKRIDQELSRLFGEDVSKATGFDSGVNPVNFSDIASKPWVAEYDENGRLTTNTAYNYFVNKEKAQRQASGQSLLDESAYTYENLTGTHVLSVFRYTQPREEDMVEDVLMGEYSELDLNSELVNTKFREDVQEELQPKNLEEYKNKNWETIQSDPKLKDFYDTLLKVMHDAYSLLPNFDADKMLYVMPQMRDRDAKLMFRNRHFITNMGASIADAFTIVETDTKYNETFSQRADGSYVETIPIRWVSKLKDPSIICTDLTKSVTLFYEMAQNYKNKADINPMLLAMLFLVQGGFSDRTKEGGQTQQAERILKYLQMYVYGRTRTGFESSKPMSKRAMAVSQITDTILSKAHAKLMNHNWRAVLKNFVDSFLTDMGEILSGKYITVQDALWANRQMAIEMFDTVCSFGRANNKSLISALMQLNGVSGGIGEIFAQHNETWLRRVLSKHFAMGEYTLVDYTFKGHLTASLYHSIRLVKNPITKELEYMTKDQAMFHYHDAGLRMEDGVKAWKRAKKTLFDAYEVDDKGNAVVKERYKKYVYPTVKATGQQSRRLVNQVTGTIRERSSVVNGILDQSGNAAWKQNVAGALILQMRGWMITQMWDNLKDGNDFAEYESQWRQVIDDEANTPISIPGVGGSQKKRSINGLEYRVRQEDPEYHGQYNFETGTVETGQWRGLWSSFKHGLADLTYRIATAYKHIRKIENSEEYKKKLTRNERYKLRRISTMAATFLIVCALTYITTGLRIKYPDEWYLSLLNAVNISVISERASQIPVLNLSSVLDIVNSLVISKTLIEDADKIVNSIEDIIEMSEDSIYGIDDPEYDNPIKSGAYKGLEKYLKDFLKTGSYIFPDLSIDNVFRSMSKSGNEASINYYIHNVSPTKQAVGVAENVMPWMFNWTGTDLGFTPQERKKKSKTQYSNF